MYFALYSTRLPTYEATITWIKNWRKFEEKNNKNNNKKHDHHSIKIIIYSGCYYNIVEQLLKAGADQFVIKTIVFNGNRTNKLIHMH